jgi:hypothetical protein
MYHQSLNYDEKMEFLCYLIYNVEIVIRCLVYSYSGADVWVVSGNILAQIYVGRKQTPRRLVVLMRVMCMLSL